ncbi:MAG: hypothetical protein K1X83_10275 [Oligoflexia bacterium]|nr:hypothetical protein [Oligoflexia bacterium]
MRQIALVLLTLVVAQSVAHAATRKDALRPSCVEQVQDCFGSSGNQRAECFYAAATSPGCETTALGKLTYKRWAMSPIRLPGHEAAPAFLGPQLVDGACIENFDSQMYGALNEGALTADVAKNLDAKLDQCKQLDQDFEIPRP